jgi:hypothetical protein
MQRVLVGKPEGTIPFQTRGHRLGNNIKKVVQDTKWEAVNWFNVTQGRDYWRAVVSMVMNFWVSSNVKEILTG